MTHNFTDWDYDSLRTFNIFELTPKNVVEFIKAIVLNNPHETPTFLTPEEMKFLTELMRQVPTRH